jgi:hypothetical protein
MANNFRHRTGGIAMEQNNSQLAGAVRNLAEATMVDLPLLAIGRLFDRSFDDELRKVRWKAYDAGVAITTELTNRLYSSRRVGRISSRALDASLKLQRLADAASGAFFAALWPMVGLPTASEMRRLTDEVESLREQLRPSELAIEVGHQLRFEEALPRRQCWRDVPLPTVADNRGTRRGGEALCLSLAN